MFKSVLDFSKAKLDRRPISMVTSYDSWSARIVAQSPIDCVLVGDSVTMTLHGFNDTIRATDALMALHVASVRRAMPEGFVIGDMPFLAHRGSFDRTLRSVRRLMAAGANAIKIEGADGSVDDIARIVESGVPVMGHLGLTPQSVHQLGGFKLQGAEAEAQERIQKQALALQDAGVFAIVLECVPHSCAHSITASLRIPTIGIGAGNSCDGQVLVMQDLLGLSVGFKPKFVRSFLNGAEQIAAALKEYDQSVKDGSFPSEKETYQ